ncbi:MAG TPA: enoyl-CoA hydratase/isomerase family protein, partial [Aggregatilineales bacterium]|nr:enoyl-CoA hydratase/isomerase family protein [Aggregatilineales bacterium]
MPDFAKLLIQRTPSGIVTLTFNRPEVRNALDRETQSLFLDTMHSLVKDSSGVRVVIITGAGDKAFCAGGDMVELAGLTSESDGERLASIMGEALDLLENAPFPSIAAINGQAIGGGTEIALACDMRIMSEKATFGMVQLSLGLTPGWGAGQRLLRLAGYSRALEMLLRAESIPADDLHDYVPVNA